MYCYVFAWTPLDPAQANSVCILQTNAALARVAPDWTIDLRFTDLTLPPAEALKIVGLTPPPNLKIDVIFPGEDPPLTHDQIYRIFYNDPDPPIQALCHKWLDYWREQFTANQAVVYTRNPQIFVFFDPIRDSVREFFVEIHRLKYLSKLKAEGLPPTLSGIKAALRRQRDAEDRRIQRGSLAFCISQTLEARLRRRMPSLETRLLRSGFHTGNGHSPIPPQAGRDLDLLYCGQLYQWKGVPLILEALRHCDPAVRLTVVGGNRQDNLYYCQQVAEHLGVADRIDWVGQVPHHHVRQFQLRAKIGLVPLSFRHRIGRWYTSPIKIFELMANGSLVLASNLPSMRDILQPGVTGELAPHDSPRAWGRRIDQLLADDAHRQRVTTAAADYVRHFSYEWRGMRIRDGIAELMAARKQPV